MTRYKITFTASNGKELVKVYNLTQEQLAEAYYRMERQHKGLGGLMIIDIKEV